MGTRTLAVGLALMAALMAETLIGGFAPLPLRALVGLVVGGVAYYYGYPFLKKLKEGDF
jgi:hypothetical protein